jgi:hypothetical protein
VFTYIVTAFLHDVKYNLHDISVWKPDSQGLLSPKAYITCRELHVMQTGLLITESRRSVAWITCEGFTQAEGKHELFNISFETSKVQSECIIKFPMEYEEM